LTNFRQLRTAERWVEDRCGYAEQSFSAPRLAQFGFTGSWFHAAPMATICDLANDIDMCSDMLDRDLNFRHLDSCDVLELDYRCYESCPGAGGYTLFPRATRAMRVTSSERPASLS
jgi:hypothetical protein